MEQRKVKTLSNNAKTIKISGQNVGPIDGVDCLYDCHIVEKEEVKRVYHPNMMPCYTVYYKITADYYNASWTAQF